MRRMILSACLASHVLVTGFLAGAAADSLAVQQNSSRNYVYVIQARSPFHTHNQTITATTGNTTVTEIIAIGPDPAPLSVNQAGVINRASIYQRGTAPNLDVRQDGMRNVVRSQQYSMP